MIGSMYSAVIGGCKVPLGSRLLYLKHICEPVHLIVSTTRARQNGVVACRSIASRAGRCFVLPRLLIYECGKDCPSI